MICDSPNLQNMVYSMRKTDIYLFTQACRLAILGVFIPFKMYPKSSEEVGISSGKTSVEKKNIGAGCLPLNDFIRKAWFCPTAPAEKRRLRTPGTS